MLNNIRNICAHKNIIYLLFLTNKCIFDIYIFIIEDFCQHT